jgi:AcrR family transcriptional regulator
MARRQAERRSETRQQLLAAARDVVAARGVAGASVDALAEAADRTSGALYAQFGGKDGLLLALLDAWKDATATVIAAEFESAHGVDDRLASLWRNFADPPAGGGDAWVMLEHELWLYACRNPHAAPPVAARYEDARRHLAEALSRRERDPGERDPSERDPGKRDRGEGGRPDCGLAALLIGLVIGLEMQRRLDPSAIPDELALAGLRALLHAAPAAQLPPG